MLQIKSINKVAPTKNNANNLSANHEGGCWNNINALTSFDDRDLSNEIEALQIPLSPQRHKTSDVATLFYQGLSTTSTTPRKSLQLDYVKSQP